MLHPVSTFTPPPRLGALKSSLDSQGVAQIAAADAAAVLAAIAAQSAFLQDFTTSSNIKGQIVTITPSANVPADKLAIAKPAMEVLRDLLNNGKRVLIAIEDDAAKIKTDNVLSLLAVSKGDTFGAIADQQRPVAALPDSAILSSGKVLSAPESKYPLGAVLAVGAAAVGLYFLYGRKAD